MLDKDVSVAVARGEVIGLAVAIRSLFSLSSVDTGLSFFSLNSSKSLLSILSLVSYKSSDKLYFFLKNDRTDIASQTICIQQRR